MTERIWRLTLGVIIIGCLSVEMDMALKGLIALLYFEALTNIRFTKLISRIRYRENYIAEMEQHISIVRSPRIFNFEAERMLRILMATTLLAGVAGYQIIGLATNPVWFVPWLVGLMLGSAGLTNICPMLMVFQWLGFKPKYH